MHIVIGKAARELVILDSDRLLYRCPVALGRNPIGAKEREGDGKTPEGDYYVCLIKEHGKYGRSLGLSYPNVRDAQSALCAGRIAEAAFQAIVLAHQRRVRPPWGTALGGEIYLHEGGAASDWTQGCVALEPRDMDVLFPLCNQIDGVRIQA